MFFLVLFNHPSSTFTLCTIKYKQSRKLGHFPLVIINEIIHEWQMDNIREQGKFVDKKRKRKFQILQQKKMKDKNIFFLTKIKSKILNR